MPVDLKPSNLKNKKAFWTTSEGSNESGSENMEETYLSPRPTHFKSQPRATEPEKIQSHQGQSRRTPSCSGMDTGSSNVLFGESWPLDEIGYSPKTKPPPDIEGVTIRSDGSSPKQEAASSRNYPGILQLGEFDAIIIKFQIEYEPRCREFEKNPPPDAIERKKLYDILSETIMQNVILKADALNTTTKAEEGTLRMEKKRLIMYAQSALARLDQVMEAS